MSLAGACGPGQAVSGMKVARARVRRRYGTWEPRATRRFMTVRRWKDSAAGSSQRPGWSRGQP